MLRFGPAISCVTSPPEAGLFRELVEQQENAARRQGSSPPVSDVEMVETEEVSLNLSGEVTKDFNYFEAFGSRAAISSDMSFQASMMSLE